MASYGVMIDEDPVAVASTPVDPFDVSVDDGGVDWYRILEPALLRFAVGLVGAADAPDVLSTAFARVVGHQTWSTVANRRAYLYRAVHNEAADLLRRDSRRRRRESRQAEADRWELPDLHPYVRAAVLGLSHRQRAVIVLTYWADLDPASVAQRLGISEGSVRRHLARARATLRKVLP
ncbi:SigE family RNA polymerase sigma factor [soil metagenome]